MMMMVTTTTTIIYSMLSEHYAHCTDNTSKVFTKQCYKEVRDLSQTNILGLRSLLRSDNWAEVFSETDIVKNGKITKSSSIIISVLPRLWLGKSY